MACPQYVVTPLLLQPSAHQWSLHVWVFAAAALICPAVEETQAQRKGALDSRSHGGLGPWQDETQVGIERYKDHASYLSRLRPRSWQVSSPFRHSQEVSVPTPSGLPLLPHWASGVLRLESSRAWER